MLLLQCLQALEKISREQPLACLQAGAIKAVLSFVDFFSTSVQVSIYVVYSHVFFDRDVLVHFRHV